MGFQLQKYDINDSTFVANLLIWYASICLVQWTYLLGIFLFNQPIEFSCVLTVVISCTICSPQICQMNEEIKLVQLEKTYLKQWKAGIFDEKKKS